MTVVQIPSDDPSTGTWEALMDICAKQPAGWTLIGAQMVALHGYEHEVSMHRVSDDADLLVDVRLIPKMISSFSEFLIAQGFSLEGINREGIGHRFVRGPLVLDVLAPDGLHVERSNVTTIPPARTVMVPGGTQGLKRTEVVDVRTDEKEGKIPRPSLAGAIVLKARAVTVDDVPEAQLRDLAFLLGLVADPVGLKEELTPKEVGYLRPLVEKLTDSSPVWRAVPAQRRSDAQAALAYVLG